MFLLDDILLFPVKGVASLGQKILDAAQQEFANEAEAVRTQLSELYLMLETGKITEAEFDAQEKELLDRLDAIEARGSEAEEEDDGTVAEEEAASGEEVGEGELAAVKCGVEDL